MSLGSVCQILRYRGRSDLAALLSRASIRFEESDTFHSQVTLAEIHAPIEDYEQLRQLCQEDREAVLAAVREIWPRGLNEPDIVSITYRLDSTSLQEEHDPGAELLEEIGSQRNLMIAVATGGSRIDSVNEEYRERYEGINAALRKLGIRNPNPYRDLWDWYGKWSSGDLPTYQSRRDYIRGLFATLEQRLREGESGRGAEVFAEPTGWPRVDRSLGEARKRLEEASSEEQFQAVGLICREALITLAQTVYDPTRCPAVDGVAPSETDAKRMLDAYLAVELAGSQNEAARKHARASLDLANALQHQRTATFRDAALCAEATASVVNIIAIVSGRRDPEVGPR